MEQTGELDKTDGQVTASQHENLYKVTSAGGKITKVARVDSKGNELWHVGTNDSATSWLSPDGRTEIKDKGGKYYIYETTSETAYVNKENLGYPLNPNSQEFLVQLDLGLPKGGRPRPSSSTRCAVTNMGTPSSSTWIMATWVGTKPRRSGSTSLNTPSR